MMVTRSQEIEWGIRAYYVYLHKTVGGEVFYVGKGQGNRCDIIAGRPPGWFEIARTRGWVVEKPFIDLKHNEALELEAELIRKHAATITNINIPGSKRNRRFK